MPTRSSTPNGTSDALQLAPSDALALIAPAPQIHLTDAQLQTEFVLDSWILPTWLDLPHEFLNIWMRLPLVGGNSIMFREKHRDEQHQQLVKYPRFNKMNLQIWFHSEWFATIEKGMEPVQLIDADVLKRCPQGHLWPYCTWCHKFHLPFQGANSHRCSVEHKKNVTGIA